MINIYDVISSTMRNHPLHASTCSQCRCDRGSRRGSEPCLDCIKEALISSNKLDARAIDLWFQAISVQNQMTRTIINLVGEDMKFDSLYNQPDLRGATDNGSDTNKA